MATPEPSKEAISLPLHAAHLAHNPMRICLAKHLEAAGEAERDSGSTHGGSRGLEQTQLGPLMAACP